MATGGKSSHLLYTKIEQQQKSFIESKYLPSNTMIKQPRNLPKAVIKEIFEHISKRQEFNGPEESFRFKSVKMGNNIVPACYPALRLNGDADADADADAKDIIDASPHCENTCRSQTKNVPILHHSIFSPIHHLTDGHNTVSSAKGHANNVLGANGRLTAIHDHYDSAGLNTGCCNEATFVVINHTVMR